jgi:hypothetical protein
VAKTNPTAMRTTPSMTFRPASCPVVGRLVRPAACGSAEPVGAWAATVGPVTARADGVVVVSERGTVIVAVRATVIDGLDVVDGLVVVGLAEVEALAELEGLAVVVVDVVVVDEVVVDVLGAVGAATVTTCHTPPKDMMPSPLASLGLLSPPYRYSGRPLSVTWSPFAFVVDPRPVTPAPGVGDIPAATTSGGQNMVHAPEHSTGLPLLVRV